MHQVRYRRILWRGMRQHSAVHGTASRARCFGHLTPVVMVFSPVDGSRPGFYMMKALAKAFFAQMTNFLLSSVSRSEALSPARGQA